MNHPRQTTDATFATDIAAPLVVVDFWAAWCGPCLAFAPVFEQAAGENPDFTFLKLDVDANPAAAAHYDIRSIPTTLFLRDGQVVNSITGTMNGKALGKALEDVRALD